MYARAAWLLAAATQVYVLAQASNSLTGDVVFSSTGGSVSSTALTPGSSNTNLIFWRYDRLPIDNIGANCTKLPTNSDISVRYGGSASTKITFGTRSPAQGALSFPLTVAADAPPGTYTIRVAQDSSICDESGNEQSDVAVVIVGASVGLEISVGETLISADTFAQATPSNIGSNALTITITPPAGASFIVNSYTAASVLRFPALLGTPSAPTVAADEITFTVSDVGSAAFGQFEISVIQGSLTVNVSNANVVNGGVTKRVVIGAPTLFFNAVTGAAYPVYRSNATHLTHHINAVRLEAAQVLAAASIKNLNATYSSITRVGSDADLSGSITGWNTVATANGTRAITKLDISTLPEGIFLLTRNTAASFADSASTNEVVKRNVVWVIDRTAPVATARTAAVPAVATRQNVAVSLPTNLFQDAVSGSDITVTSITPINGQSAGFVAETLPVALSSARIVASTVSTGIKNAVFRVVGADVAGNTATAVFTLPITQPPKPALSIADKRRVFTSALRTGGSSTLTGSALVLTIVASFAESVTGLTASSLSITSDVSTGSITVGTPVSSSNGQVWTFTATLSVATFAGRQLSFNIADGSARRTSDSVTSIPGTAATAIIDNVAPTFPDIVLAGPTLNIEYFSYIPYNSSFTDTTVASPGENTPAGSSAANFDVLSATVDVNGLALVPGKLSRASIVGTVRNLPSVRTVARCGVTAARWVVVSLRVADEAGNIATPVVCINVNTAVDGLSSTSLTFSTAALTVAEGASARTLDSSAGFSYAAKTISVYLEADSLDAAVESLLATNPSSGDYTLTAFAALTPTVGVVTLTSASSVISTAHAQAFLRSIQYSNTATASRPGLRQVRVVASASSSQQVAYASKKISFTITNDAPVLSGTVAVTFTEGDDFVHGAPLATELAIADADDDYISSATVRISAEVSNTAGGCDNTRDSLRLPSNYAASPRVTGTWDASTCTLILTSVDNFATKAEFALALRSVRYYNSDQFNPTNFVTTPAWKLKRRISITVTDSRANGLATSASTSSSLVGDVTISLVDDAPSWNWSVFYGKDGISGCACAANVVRFRAPDNAIYPVSKIPLIYSADSSNVYDFVVNLDLSSTGTNGVFARGALVDLDTATPDIDGEDISLELGKFNAETGVFTAQTLSNIVLAEEDLANTYVEDGVSSFNITVTEGANTYNGAFAVRITYGASGPAALILFDARVKKCVLSDDYNSALHSPDSSLCQSGESNKFEITGSSGATKSLGGFTAREEQLSALSALLVKAGMTAEERVAAATEQRAAARGSIRVAIPENSFGSTSGTLDLVVRPLESSELASLPALPYSAQFDNDVTLALGPACQQFSKPVRVCIYVGNTGDEYKRALKISSLIDCADPSKGYGPWEAMQNVEHDAVTGLVCGETSHFSVVSPALVPLPTTDTVSKVFSMGGSCPNDCSGRGFCRQEGKCTCFAGFEGYDCSQRSCPAADAWDQVSGAVHQAAVCSNRGNCDTKTGSCKCFSGFEGAACQRNTCPNSCSGHGRCRLMSELPAVQQAGYSSWEVSRLQKCVCDGGYTGVDCSERICPAGDDPETICAASDRQIQTVSLDFGWSSDLVPAAGNLAISVEGDLSLVFQHFDGSNFSTPTVTNVFTANGDARLQSALKSLPGFAISDVSVSSSQTARKYEFDVEFDGASLLFSLNALASARLTSAGNTVPGNQKLLVCPTAPSGALGCTAPGCRPLFQQPRIVSLPTSDDVKLSEGAILQKPTPLTDGDESATGVWDAVVRVTITSSGTYYVDTLSVYGEVTGDRTLESLPETPLPPAGLRSNVQLLHGLVVDFKDTIILPSAGNTNAFTFYWRLPTCTVEEDTSAGSGFEQVECSRRGNCDRKTGSCKCFAGYSGSNCGTQSVIV